MQLKFRTQKRTRVKFFSGRSELEARLKGKGFRLVADRKVKWPLSSGSTIYWLPAGEKAKRWHELEKVIGWLARQDTEKSQRLIAVGGGAALDLAAMSASLYRRGMGLVLVPTTLLAMVDATLGGKTAVDGKAQLKNFAGTFYPADEVWVCLDFLRTLPRKERISGAGECWKTLWLSGSGASGALISFVANAEISPSFRRLVKKCLRFKKEIVEQDPLDTKRIRECLNYGHTIGHALEALARGRISHGEAVLWGMAVESLVLGRPGEAMARRILGVINALGLSVPKEFSLGRRHWLAFLKGDKKLKGGKIELTVLSAPGKLHQRKVLPEVLLELIKGFPAFARP